MRLARFTAAALVAAIVAVLTSGPAWAHNSLTKAVPDKNSTVKRSPEQVEENASASGIELDEHTLKEIDEALLGTVAA